MIFLGITVLFIVGIFIGIKVYEGIQERERAEFERELELGRRGFEDNLLRVLDGRGNDSGLMPNEVFFQNFDTLDVLVYQELPHTSTSAINLAFFYYHLGFDIDEVIKIMADPWHPDRSMIIVHLSVDDSDSDRIIFRDGIQALLEEESTIAQIREIFPDITIPDNPNIHNISLDVLDFVIDLHINNLGGISYE